MQRNIWHVKNIDISACQNSLHLASAMCSAEAMVWGSDRHVRPSGPSVRHTFVFALTLERHDKLHAAN
jgi:hypothetical protein